jgi:hypothetical protein
MPDVQNGTAWVFARWIAQLDAIAMTFSATDSLLRHPRIKREPSPQEPYKPDSRKCHRNEPAGPRGYNFIARIASGNQT